MLLWTSSLFYDGMGFYWSHSSFYIEDGRQKCNRKMSKNNDNHQRYIKLKTSYFVSWIKCNLLRCLEKGEKNWRYDGIFITLIAKYAFIFFNWTELISAYSLSSTFKIFIFPFEFEMCISMMKTLISKRTVG